eukprot:TRINITY_DN5893_c0_g1_i1.p2 TRINITY_DN5893_c0_g1~~TRINITY_DN5893_c0_g1_i1.p2  ORF type:complete len:350 (-),score=69.56 TRINITY_DN5893_c0_g1_i1:1138-2187(-)
MEAAVRQFRDVPPLPTVKQSHYAALGFALQIQASALLTERELTLLAQILDTFQQELANLSQLFIDRRTNVQNQKSPSAAIRRDIDPLALLASFIVYFYAEEQLATFNAHRKAQRQAAAVWVARLKPLLQSGVNLRSKLRKAVGRATSLQPLAITVATVLGTGTLTTVPFADNVIKYYALVIGCLLGAHLAQRPLRRLTSTAAAIHVGDKSSAAQNVISIPPASSSTTAVSRRQAAAASLALTTGALGGLGITYAAKTLAVRYLTKLLSKQWYMVVLMKGLESMLSKWTFSVDTATMCVAGAAAWMMRSLTLSRDGTDDENSVNVDTALRVLTEHTRTIAPHVVPMISRL